MPKPWSHWSPFSGAFLSDLVARGSSQRTCNKKRMVEGGWKVASFNIRMKTQEPDPNDNWDFRKDALLQELVNSQAAIIGLQEGWTPAVSSIFACSFFIILPSFPHGHKMSQMSQRTLCANFISFISFILSGGETWAVGLPEVVVGRAWLFKYWCWTRCCFHPRMASCIIYIYI